MIADSDNATSIEGQQGKSLSGACMQTGVRAAPSLVAPLSDDEIDAMPDGLDSPEMDPLIDATLGVNCAVCGRRVMAFYPARRKTCSDRCRKRLSRVRHNG